MPCQHIAETRHHDFGDKCWGISSISQIDDRCEYTTLLPFKGHVPVARVLRGLCLTQFFNARLLFTIRFSWSYDRRIEAGLAEPHGRTAGPDSGRPSALIDLTSPQGESRDGMGWCDGLLMNLVPLLRLH